MLLIATFSPAAHAESTSLSALQFITGNTIFDKFSQLGIITVAHEILIKLILGAIDILGLYLVFTYNFVTGEDETRVLNAGIGWTLGEVISSRLAPLWVGARGLEFEWKHLQLAMVSNLNMILYLALATLVYLRYRTKWAHSASKTAMGLVFIILIPILAEYVF